MLRFRVWLIVLLLFIGIALNIERLDIGGTENVVNIASFVYVLFAIATISTILLPSNWRISTQVLIVFWVVIYLLIKVFGGSGTPLVGGIYTYLSLTEGVILVTVVLLTRIVVGHLNGLEETIANITMGDVSKRVVNLDAATDEIKKEFARSRRYSRPVGVVVIRFEPNNIEENLDSISQDILLTMMSKYSMSRLIRQIDKTIRRPDLILENYERNRIILVLPETDTKAAEVVANNVNKISVERFNTPVKIGFAAFPEDAVIFEDLVNRAEQRLEIGIETTIKQSVMDT